MNYNSNVYTVIIIPLFEARGDGIWEPYSSMVIVPPCFIGLTYSFSHAGIAHGAHNYSRTLFTSSLFCPCVKFAYRRNSNHESRNLLYNHTVSAGFVAAELCFNFRVHTRVKNVKLSSMSFPREAPPPLYVPQNRLYSGKKIINI